MNRKDKIKAMIEQGSNTTNFSHFDPGYSSDTYFGASSFYGDQCRTYELKFDMIKKEHTWFIPRSSKAIGRQEML